MINELGAVPHDVAVVLDDYHVIESPDIEEGMIFLLEHLPSQVHVVIATRADPRLPLARCVREANWSRSAPPTCASPTRKPRRTSAPQGCA